MSNCDAVAKKNQETQQKNSKKCELFVCFL